MCKVDTGIDDGDGRSPANAVGPGEERPAADGLGSL